MVEVRENGRSQRGVATVLVVQMVSDVSNCVCVPGTYQTRQGPGHSTCYDYLTYQHTCEGKVGLELLNRVQVKLCRAGTLRPGPPRRQILIRYR